MSALRLRDALLFYADFDQGFDAVFSRGDGRARLEVDAYPPCLTTDGGGRFGEAAEFCCEAFRESIWTHDVLRYPAAGNFPYRRDREFAGTIGLWLQVDMAALRQRPLIWLDPIHLLGPQARDQGKMWMDLVMAELEGAPLFRFGATLPRHLRRHPEDSDEGNIIVVPRLGFTGAQWHQVIGTWQGINGGTGAGRLQLYFDGRLVGNLAGFAHRLDWQISEWEIRIGLGFRGRIDDLFILDRSMAAGEVAELYAARAPFGRFCDLR